MQGEKKAKQRFMVALIVNAAGGKESAIVIWKAEKTRCFKGVDVSKLPVKYFSHANAWMTGERQSPYKIESSPFIMLTLNCAIFG